MRECLTSPFSQVEGKLQQLSELFTVLGEQIERSDLPSLKKEMLTLKDNLADVRTYVQAEFTVLWKHISKLEQLQEVTPEKDAGNVGDKPQPRVSSKDKHSSSRLSARKKTSTSRKYSLRKDVRDPDSDSDSDSPLSSDAESDLDDVEVADELCRRVMQVETYRLLDRNPERNPRLKVAKSLAELRHLFDGEMFDGSDPLSLLHFLEDMKQTFDDAALAEGDAKHMIRYFMTGEAAKLFKGLSTNERGSYRRILRWLLRTYIREGMIQDAREKFLTRAQNPSETELEYSKTLSGLAHRCGGLISEVELTNRFLRGLQPAIRTHVQSKLSGVQSWAVAVATASDYGDAHREEIAARTKPRTPRFTPVPRRSLAGTSGRALLTQQTPVTPELQEESDVDLAELADLQEVDEAGDPIGAIHWGASPLARSPSLGSYASSSGSTGTVYRTPTLTRSPSVLSPAPELQGRKVMLPPGVPYPAGPRPKGPARPCIGCGKIGHWIANCPCTSSQVKEIVLEALRARKAARQQARTPEQTQTPSAQRAVTLLKHDQDTENSPQPGDEVQPEESG